MGSDARMKFNWPEKTALSKSAFQIVKKLRAAGFETYIAGGAVRDALLKRKITDIDIATAAKPSEVKKLFAKTIPTGEKHGTMTVRASSINYEVTTFRLEGAYEDARRPKTVKFINSPEKDAMRRDFTINAMFYDPQSSEIIDYAEGVEDIRRRRVRTVGEADKRFREDALRMMRAVRLATVLDFKIERETRNSVERNAKLITKISAERIKQELDKIIMSDKPGAGIGLLDAIGLLKYILPELKAGQGVEHGKGTHFEGDVYAHCVLAVEKAVHDLTARYAALFHDLGKINTREEKSGKVTFYNHGPAGADLWRVIAKRLRFSRHETIKIDWLIRYHMVPDEFQAMKNSTRRKWALSPYFEDLLALKLADHQAILDASGKVHDGSKAQKLGKQILKEVRSKPQLKKPILSGNEIMNVLKIKSGPLIGKVLKFLEEKKLADKIKTKTDALNYLRKNKKYFLHVDNS